MNVTINVLKVHQKNHRNKIFHGQSIFLTTVTIQMMRMRMAMIPQVHGINRRTRVERRLRLRATRLRRAILDNHVYAGNIRFENETPNIPLHHQKTQINTTKGGVQ